MKRFLFGKPFRTDRLHHTLLPKRLALPVFSADAISSVAYAPQEILLTLAAAGAMGYAISWQVGIAVTAVLAIVIAAYRQNVRAYPGGGGDYHVAKSTIGPTAGLVTASALIVDYVLTVAVSVSAATQYAAAAMPALRGFEVGVALVALATLAFINLRGMRESGRLSAIPTYAFLGCIAALGVTGAVRALTGTMPQAYSAQFELVPQDQFTTGALSMAMALLVLRAFSSGCAALTGVEAISNGVPHFREPKTHNATTTLALLGAICCGMFLTVLWLAHATGVKYVNESGTDLMLSLDGQMLGLAKDGSPQLPDGATYVQLPVIGQLADTLFAGWWPAFLLVTASTGLVLLLAANTAFGGFPVLASELARDEMLPRQLRSRGDRLVYSNGIIALAGAAAALIVLSGAEVTFLIQLYIVGVFVSFTASQLGMVRHWTAKLNLEREPARRRAMLRSRVINGLAFGCVALTLVVVVVSKFAYGAWATLLAMLAIVTVMRMIKAHYSAAAAELAVSTDDSARQLPSRVTAILVVSTMHRATLQALSCARATRPSTLEAVIVGIDDAQVRRVQQQWHDLDIPIPLKVLESPYRDLARPVVDYVKGIRRSSPRELVMVYLPEYVVGRWWEAPLHNQSAARLKSQLRFTKGVVVTSVPWQLRSSEGLEELLYPPESGEHRA